MHSIYREWHAFSREMTRSREVLEELSKLYLIIHENIRAMMRKCATNPAFDPTTEATKHLEFIKDILLRLNERHKDEYLAKADKGMLCKYEEQLFGLVDQIEAIIRTQRSKINLTLTQLTKHTPSHLKEPHSLKQEVVMSDRRRLRSKSGQRKNTPLDVQQQEEYESLIPNQEEHISESNKIGKQQSNRLDLGAYKNESIQDELLKCREEYKKIKEKLELEMTKQIEVRNNQVFFGNKYKDDNFQKYVRYRKEFADMIFAQKTFDKMFNHKDEKQLENALQAEAQKSARETVANELFPEFKIQTKFMKNKVKENILNVLFEAKQELLEQFHTENIEKLCETSREEKCKEILLSTPIKIKPRGNSSGVKQNEIKKTLSKPTYKSVKYLNARQEALPKVYLQTPWNKRKEAEFHTTLTKTVSEAKFNNISPLYNKRD